MSLPITAVGPLKVETNPILMVSAASAGFASAKTVAPASQNAVFISLSLLVTLFMASQSTCPLGESAALRSRPFFLSEVFCARDRRSAASTNRRLPLRTFGSMQVLMHHNSYGARMARIIVHI